MSDATSIPILLDGDTRYGNFNNVRRLIKKLEQRDIAGVCIEDKLFPKTNSFINGESQKLADINEFFGKIKAAKDTQKDPDFCLVARIEAFIAGLGLDEALNRAHAYADAGADAILVHSKKTTVDDIDSFMNNWDRDTPIIIVPTKYYITATNRFRQLGIFTVIWANHSIRSATMMIQKIMKQIYNDEHLKNVENIIVPVSELFLLQGAPELATAEKNYLSGHNNDYNIIILAAGPSKFGHLTKDIPKALLKIRGKSILDHQVFSPSPLKALPLDTLEQQIKDYSPTHIAIVHHKTTTGLLNDIHAIGTLAKRYNIILCVDAMSSFGAIEIDIIKDNIHFCATSSNKNIQGMPGIGIVIA